MQAQLMGHPVTQNDAEKFKQHITQNGNHWLWTGSTGGNGLGRLWIGEKKSRRLVSARRLSCALFHIPAPDVDGRSVYPTCDIRECVNPDHLQVSLIKTNWARGQRHRSQTKPRSITRGEKHPKSKLTNRLAQHIRKKAKQGYPVSEIKKQLKEGIFGNPVNVTESCIYNVITGRTWKTK